MHNETSAHSGSSVASAGLASSAGCTVDSAGASGPSHASVADLERVLVADVVAL